MLHSTCSTHERYITQGYFTFLLTLGNLQVGEIFTPDSGHTIKKHVMERVKFYDISRKLIYVSNYTNP